MLQRSALSPWSFLVVGNKHNILLLVVLQYKTRMACQAAVAKCCSCTVPTCDDKRRVRLASVNRPEHIIQNLRRHLHERNVATDQHWRIPQQQWLRQGLASQITRDWQSPHRLGSSSLRVCLFYLGGALISVTYNTDATETPSSNNYINEACKSRFNFN